MERDELIEAIRASQGSPQATTTLLLSLLLGSGGGVGASYLSLSHDVEQIKKEHVKVMELDKSQQDLRMSLQLCMAARDRIEKNNEVFMGWMTSHELHHAKEHKD